MNSSLREQVSERAGRCCEYCRIPAAHVEETFCIDHVIAKKHHGPTSLENLAFSCYWCNAYKGDNLSGFDPNTSSVIRLFNPRVDDWSMHFAWHGSTVFPLTDMGRVTVDVLCMNAPIRVELRTALLDEGITFRSVAANS